MTRPLAVAVEAVDVEQQVVAGHHVGLGVHDQYDVGLVGQGRAATQVPGAHPLAGLEALLVGRGDREDRGLEVDREVLELLGDLGDALLVGEARRRRTSPSGGSRR